MVDYKKYILGFLILLVSTSIVYVQLSDKVKIRVDIDKTTTYVPHEDYPWIWTKAGVEYNRLFDGTSIMYRDKSNIKIDTQINEETNEVLITRTTPYQRGPIIIDEYFFKGDVNDERLFPIYHKVIIKNGEGYYYRYSVDELTDTGEKRKLIDETFLKFGKNMKLELEPNYRWAWIGWPYGNDSIAVQYDINSNYEEYYIRLFDPEDINKKPYIDCKYNIEKQYEKIKHYKTEKICYNTSYYSKDCKKTDELNKNGTCLKIETKCEDIKVLDYVEKKIIGFNSECEKNSKRLIFNNEEINLGTKDCSINTDYVICDDGYGNDGNGDGICQSGETCYTYNFNKILNLKNVNNGNKVITKNYPKDYMVKLR